MALDGLVGVYRGLMETFRCLLTPKDFETNYEVLCSELSIQSLRIQLWGESVGLNVDTQEGIHNSTVFRPDIEPTILNVLDTISSLLTELRLIRQKYQRKEFTPMRSESLKQSTDQRLLNPVTTRRRRRSRRGISVVSVAKWKLCDANKFLEKVKQLKSLIDGVEDVSRIAGISFPSRTQGLSVIEDENPPRYSNISLPAPRVSTHSSQLPASTPNPEQSTPNVARVYNHDAHNTPLPTSCVSESYNLLKTYLISTTNPGRLSSRLREKLTRLSNFQFDELRTDINDELLRRQQPDIPHLPALSRYPAKRNQARQQLSVLKEPRFNHLVADVVAELEQRMPYLRENEEESTATVEFPDPFLAPRSFANRRWGYVCPSNTSPPPFLRDRPAHHSTHTIRTSPTSTSNTDTDTDTDTGADSNNQKTPLSPPSSPPPQFPPTHTVEIFKSFRVSMNDPTSIVLPAALKKYNIHVDPKFYALYVVYGDMERCLRMDEKPLILFKKLDKEGKKPMFMLRKLASARNSLERSDFGPPCVGGAL